VLYFYEGVTPLKISKSRNKIDFSQ
jgi:hypothetical protein